MLQYNSIYSLFKKLNNSDEYRYQKVFFITVFTVPVLPVIKTVTGNTGTDTAVPVKIGTGNDVMIR